MKIYKANDNLTFPLTKGGKFLKYINFSEEGNTYWASDKEEIELLDKSSANGVLFHFSKEIKTEKIKNKTKANDEPELKAIKGVLNYQDAKEYLRKEYNIPFQALNTPNSILKHAKEKEVYFPNLK